MPSPYPVERCIVDNRILLLGLDELYRRAVKDLEREELLHCAQAVAARLRVGRADVPVEGYYTEESALTEYFQLMSALRTVGRGREPEVAGLTEYERLREVTSSPIYGAQHESDWLFPEGQDSLSQALEQERPNWDAAALVDAAYAIALRDDDYSLVGLAASARDSVILTALRESVVLYAFVVEFGRSPPREYTWGVEPALAARAKRFVGTFNRLSASHVPDPTPDAAEQYWTAAKDNQVVGRCVRLGQDRSLPPRHYHWAICRARSGVLTVQAFWDDEIWTTARYRSELSLGDGCLDR